MIIKAWKSIYLVLRPNFLSIYKNQSEEKLRHKIDLCDLTAVTILKDPKHKRHHIFGLFSPSRNFHLEAQSSADAKEWVKLIRKESGVEKEEEEMFLTSPGGNSFKLPSFEENNRVNQWDQNRLHEERASSSSPELCDTTSHDRKSGAVERVNHRRPSYTVEYSGPEHTSHSDWSDTEVSRIKEPLGILPADDESTMPKSPSPAYSCGIRNISQMNGITIEQDLERVVWQGYLLCLKSKGAVRHWKDSWVVIRCKNITFYKDESEYSPNLILPFSSVINAVEIDPISKTKKFCLQIITEEKSYRLCAHNEDALDKTLGAIKCLIAKRRETRVI